MEWFQGHMGSGVPTVVALHHHLLPVPGTGRERNILLDAGEMLRTITQARVPLVLTGHKHQPWAWNLEGTVIATTGTFCSTKTNSGQNFNHVRLSDERLHIDNVDAHTGTRRTLCDVALEVAA